MTEPAILVDGLSVRLGEAEILKKVNVSVARGEFVAVIGPNGAGKSTLLRCIDGIIEPTVGRVEIGGRAIDEYLSLIHI